MSRSLSSSSDPVEAANEVKSFSPSNSRTIDPVAIRLGLRLPARMEILADVHAIHDSHSRRHQCIHRALQFLRGEIRVRLKMCDLAERVNAGIGATCAVNHDAFLRNLAECLLDGALNG